MNITLSLVLASIFSLATEDSRPLVLRGAQLFDPESGELHPACRMRVEAGRIVEIGDEVSVADDPLEIGLSGLVLMPGLIDLHSHLLLYPYDQRSWNDQVLRESLELRTIRGVAAARDTLAAGWTTLRELGTEGAGFADVGLRDAIELGIIPGPRILASTRALVATGCYGPSGFDPRWPMPVGAQVADGVDGVRRATREQIAAGADWIKVYADYRRRSGYPATPTFSIEELRAIVEEANTVGLKVSAHATTDEGARRAVLAGVSTIEHGYDIGEETFAAMKERGVVLCPTLAASESMALYSGWDGAEPLHPRVARSRAMMKRALGVGVAIACGSDVGVFAHGDNTRELELMAAAGMPTIDVIRAATSVAAEVLDRPELGRLRVGAVADLIAVRLDPRRDLTTLREPVVVVRGGELFVDRRTRTISR